MKPKSVRFARAPWVAVASIGALLVAGLALTARADDDEGRRQASVPAVPSAPAADIALWREECGACHVAYPARMLPAADWRRIMSTLDRHFGTDASLDAAAVARIESYLTRAGSTRAVERPAAVGKPAVAELPRITTQRWFLREHDSIPPSTWKDKRVGSAARCDACHLNAAQGRFDERDIRRLP
ncbi:MAG: hypothetical protein R3E65_04085 [Steroidobacteraceae bacterium]